MNHPSLFISDDFLQGDESDEDFTESRIKILNKDG